MKERCSRHDKTVAFGEGGVNGLAARKSALYSLRLITPDFDGDAMMGESLFKKNYERSQGECVVAWRSDYFYVWISERAENETVTSLN